MPAALTIYLAAVIIDGILEYKWYRSLKEVVENNGEKFEHKSQIIKGILIRCFFLNIISMLALYGVSKLNDEELSKLAETSGELSQAQIYVDDTPGISVMEIRAKCRKLKLEKDIGLVIIDYLQLVQGSGKTSSREQEIAEISRSLKILAKELDVPVIALSQLSRAVEARPDHRPMLSDLRESGSIEQDADIVMFLYRDDYYNEDSEKKNIAEVIIAKQRAGSTGTVELAWLGQYTKFANLDKYRE